MVNTNIILSLEEYIAKLKIVFCKTPSAPQLFFYADVFYYKETKFREKTSCALLRLFEKIRIENYDFFSTF